MAGCSSVWPERSVWGREDREFDSHHPDFCRRETVSSLARKVSMKRFNAKKEGIAFHLTGEQVKTLLAEAGITVEQWAIAGYHLSRYNDQGDYSIGNCRFVTYLENMRERKVSASMLRASSRNITAVLRNRSPAERTRIGRIGGKASQAAHPSGLTVDELTDKFLLVKHLDLTSRGTRGQAAKILSCSYTHVGRLKCRWRATGLIV